MVDYIGGMPEDFDPLESMKDNDDYSSMDPSWDFETKEKLPYEGLETILSSGVYLRLEKMYPK